MITITEKSRSAVIALTELAQRGSAGPVPILEVAERRGIPLHFLEQLFVGLRRAGIPSRTGPRRVSLSCRP